VKCNIGQGGERYGIVCELIHHAQQCELGVLRGGTASQCCTIHNGNHGMKLNGSQTGPGGCVSKVVFYDLAPLQSS
jgi:hypothetical protein